MMQERFSARAVVAGALLACAACSSQNEAHPPELVDCAAHDAGCAVSVSGAGAGAAAGGGGSDEAGACLAEASDSQCVQCANAMCCNDLSACASSVTCVNLANCVDTCATSACVIACEGQFPASVALISALLSCESSACPVCAELDVGDPCTAQGTACDTGLMCATSFCTKACNTASDCVGIGANAGNRFGNQNECILTVSIGRACLPGCASDADCAAFPNTFCAEATSTDGLAVQVCESLPDAGP